MRHTPWNEPGTLTAEIAADLVSFILRSNLAPAGDTADRPIVSAARTIGILPTNAMVYPSCRGVAWSALTGFS
jgi:hypothetical protein